MAHPYILKQLGPRENPRLNATVAQAAASQYCQKLVDEKVVLSDGTSDPAPAVAKGKAEDGHQMSLTVMYFQNSCPEDHSASTLDFAAIGAETCFQYLYTALEGGCSQDNTWQNYDPEWTFEGGVFGAGCGLFAISGD
ncbi:MAG: Suppressor of the cold-sensitive snRNP bioproteinsis mutant brr1-1 [Heterodermia speciosa]|uniref:Suppressor of the cold-sensitive snRNP bioproteinsis mutant brr1-1 n=1 Tax=Heterodermia speciosa TaxID=116794 RepID=A0A8H3FJC3_9LECA|nr:MAG: Suppressor of the cold-sensitive snRNP bioproteinsis mutant brr1-1 [Heterodermia speciosa]